MCSFALRVNVFERCQYDCAYCSPGSVPQARERNLSVAEYGRLAPIFATAGARKVRFTGGEPLLRADIVEVVGAFHQAMPAVKLAITTNGARLPALLRPLRDAGLAAATVHVDSLRPERYRAAMRGGPLQPVLDAVLEARDTLETVKVNVVVQRGVNDDELTDFLEWSVKTRVEVRFIELMDTGCASDFARTHLVSGREMLEHLRPVTPVARRAHADPAALFRRGGVTFGIISSETAPFCDQCDRIRLSPSGQLRGCLYQPLGLGLGSALRDRLDDSQLVTLVHEALASKQSHHPSTRKGRIAFSMASVGG